MKAKNSNSFGLQSSNAGFVYVVDNSESIVMR